MKKIVVLFALLIFTTPKSFADGYEWYFKIYSGLKTNLISKHVYVYKLDKYGEIYATMDGSTTGTASSINGFNGGCDINDDGDGGTLWPAIKIWDTLTLPKGCSTYFIVRIDNDYCYLKVPTVEDGAYGGYDFIFEYNCLTGTFSIDPDNNNRLCSIEYQGNWIQYNSTVKYNLGAGSMKFQAGFYENIPSSGKSFTWMNPSYPRKFAAVNQDFTINTKDYHAEYKEWSSLASYVVNETIKEITISEPNNAIYTAVMERFFNIEVVNELPGYGNSGQLIINNNNVTAPYNTFLLKEYLNFSIAGTNQVIDNVQFTYSHIEEGTNIITSPLTPIDHSIYKLKYTAEPLEWTRNMMANGSLGQNVTVTWNDHPSAYITYYKIYRLPKGGSEQLAGTVGGNTTSFVDTDVIVTGTDGDLYKYDVRAVYTNGIATAPLFEGGIYLDFIPKSDNGNPDEIITDYEIDNYPNPFNPSTVIRYQLPEAGEVNIKVYDMQGQEVAELVNEVKTSGVYAVQFNASRLASGTYFYVIRTNKYTETKKMLLVK